MTRAEPGRAVLLRETATGAEMPVGRFDPALPGPENRMRPLPQGFLALGGPALGRCAQAAGEWVMIDEIGYLETACPPYTAALTALMDQKRLLAAVRKQDLPFLQALLRRADVFAVDLDAPFGRSGCVIMASGLGVRFGGNKLLAPFGGQPLILRALAATAGLFARRVLVTRAPAVAQLAREQGVQAVLHSLPQRSDTVRLGLRALGGAAGLDGVLFFMPIADVLTAVASVIVILYTWKTLNQMTGTAGEENVSLRQEAAGEALTDTVITIGRSYGAGGRTIGKKVAEQLHIPYYDSEILEKVAESSGLSRKFLQSVDEKPVECSMLYRSVGFATSAYEKIADQAAQAQREIIEKVAAEGPCVIIGRSADQVLAGKHKLFRVFISSSRENRVRRIMEREGLTREKAEKKVARADRERAAYYNQRSNVRWGDAAGYDLCLDADWFHVDGACRMIAACVMQHSQKTN